jgi:hypothetical protein
MPCGTTVVKIHEFRLGAARVREQIGRAIPAWFAGNLLKGTSKAATNMPTTPEIQRYVLARFSAHSYGYEIQKIAAFGKAIQEIGELHSGSETIAVRMRSV